ncbi:hypothetical protein ACEWY4_005195 [Coilia grayii]|uniref:EF-hand domain-containing protein n=1 Tax=Coilia grayii TaxID=363190 RepID=A0ABD1KHW0_9TELE
MFAAAVVPLLLAPLLIQGAPQQGQESDRSESAAASLPLMVNPFGPAEESRSLLQNYIKANLNDQANPEVNTREQEVFFLFSLHDYDKSGQLDGLELMKLLADFLSHHSQAPTSTDGVVAMVDYLLQTQDQNQDGLLAPSELLSPPMPGAIPATDSAHGGQAKPEDEVAPEGGVAQKAESDSPFDTANEQKEPQEEAQQGGQEHQPGEGEVQGQQVQEQVPVEQDGDNEDAAGAEMQDTEQGGAHHQPEPEAAQEHQRQAEEHGIEFNTVDEQNYPPVHQGQPEM